MNIRDKLGFTPIRWDRDALVILDQRLLPAQEKYVRLKSIAEVFDAIAGLAVRGAPLIGIAAAYGLCLPEVLRTDESFNDACAKFKSARPTAVNLSWAVGRMKSVHDANNNDSNLPSILLEEAVSIHDEDAAMCEKIGLAGNEIVPDKCRILTHCNSGALATGGIGTALGVIYTAHFTGKSVEVWVDETRPLLQGSRLTAWELAKAGIPHKLIADNMAGRLMADGKVDLVITGADRIAANLDFANKTGTYSLAVLAHYHDIPFYCAAPTSTFDPGCPDASHIPIEIREDKELLMYGNELTAPVETAAYNPAFDITPHELLKGVITENSIVRPK